MIYARLDAQGTVLDFIDWRDSTPPGADMRPATAAELAALNPPPTLAQQIAPSDYKMARASEDLIVLLLSKGAVARADLNPSVLSDINARRALRGQPAV